MYRKQKNALKSLNQWLKAKPVFQEKLISMSGKKLFKSENERLKAKKGC